MIFEKIPKTIKKETPMQQKYFIRLFFMVIRKGVRNKIPAIRPNICAFDCAKMKANIKNTIAIKRSKLCFVFWVLDTNPAANNTAIMTKVPEMLKVEENPVALILRISKEFVMDI